MFEAVKIMGLQSEAKHGKIESYTKSSWYAALKNLATSHICNDLRHSFATLLLNLYMAIQIIVIKKLKMGVDHDDSSVAVLYGVKLVATGSTLGRTREPSRKL